MDWTLEDNMVNGLCFCTTQAAEVAIPHMYKQVWTRPTPLWRQLSQTQALLGRVISKGCVSMSGITVRSLAGFSAHSAFH